MKKFDPLVALSRQQQLAAAARAAVDGRLPELTAVDVGLPNSLLRKTNPNANVVNPPQAAGLHGASLRRPVGDVRDAQKSAQPSRRAVDEGLLQLTPVDRGLPKSRACERNPIERGPLTGAPGELSPRQLAAARAVARGQTVAQAAAEVGVSRQALWKWRRREAFVEEVRRLHELLARYGDGGRRG